MGIDGSKIKETSPYKPKTNRPVCSKGFLIVIAIIFSFVAYSLLSTPWPQINKPNITKTIPIEEKSLPQLEIASTDRMVICPGTTSAIFFQPIETINIDKVEDEIMYLSYIRKSDNTEWKNLCKISGNRVIWAAPGGRWRDGPYDAVITYQLTEDQVIIRQKFSDNSVSTNTFRRL